MEMRTRFVGAVVAAAAIVVLAPTPAAGQALPRTPDGKPDLSGIWQVVNSAAWNILPHPADLGPEPLLHRLRLQPGARSGERGAEEQRAAPRLPEDQGRTALRAAVLNRAIRGTAHTVLPQRDPDVVRLFEHRR